MEAASSLPYDRRVDRVRRDCHAAGLDGLLVTHPPNVRYLTGLSATAGAVVLTPTRCVLIADFRYATAARDLVAARTPGAIELEVPERGYDEAIVSVLRQSRCRPGRSRRGVAAGQPIQLALVVTRLNGRGRESVLRAVR